MNYSRLSQSRMWCCRKGQQQYNVSSSVRRLCHVPIWTKKMQYRILGDFFTQSISSVFQWVSSIRRCLLKKLHPSDFWSLFMIDKIVKALLNCITIYPSLSGVMKLLPNRSLLNRHHKVLSNKLAVQRDNAMHRAIRNQACWLYLDWMHSFSLISLKRSFLN